MQIKLDLSVKKILEQINPKRFLLDNKDLVFKALENSIRLMDNINFSYENGYNLIVSLLVNGISVGRTFKDARLRNIDPHGFYIEMDVKHLATLSFEDGISFEYENERRKIVVIDEDDVKKIEIPGYGQITYKKLNDMYAYSYFGRTDEILDVPGIYQSLLQYRIFYVEPITPKHVFVRAYNKDFFVNGENETISKIENCDLIDYFAKYPGRGDIERIHSYELPELAREDIFIGMRNNQTLYVIANFPSQNFYSIVWQRTFNNNDENLENILKETLSGMEKKMITDFLNDLLS